MGHYYHASEKILFDCDIREAKKNNLYPSITTILSVLDKPGLTYWYKQQAALAALTLPREHGESDDDFIRRIISDSKSEATGAADIGTIFHDKAENYAKTGRYVISEKEVINKMFASFKDWFDENVDDVIDIEEIYHCQSLKLACKADLFCILKDGRRALIDYKTQKVKSKELKSGWKQYPEFYFESMCAQLAGQRMALIESSDILFTPLDISCFNLVVSTLPDNDGNYNVFEKEWTPSELVDASEIVRNCRSIFKIIKGI